MNLRSMREIVKQVHNELINNQYSKAKDLAKKLNIHKFNAYNSIRILREGGSDEFKDPIGVHSTKKGYILSEFAGKVDDVNYLRKLTGRRHSDYIGVRACLRHVQNRWSTLKDRKDLKAMTEPLTAGNSLLGTGLSVVLRKSAELGC